MVDVLKKGTMMEYLSKLGDEATCVSARIVRDGKILLGLRHYTPDKWQKISVWTTPGGRCDSGETLEETLRRETREETGICDLQILGYLGEVPGAKGGDTLHVFSCFSMEEPILMEPEKFSEWRWVDTKEIPENFINPEALQLLK